MTTSNPYEIERVRKRNELIEETKRLAENRVESESIESIIAERDALKCELENYCIALQNVQEDRNYLTSELAIAHAEITRLNNQPKDGA